MHFQVSQFSQPSVQVGTVLGFLVRPGTCLGAVWIAISAGTHLNPPFPGTKLDVPMQVGCYGTRSPVCNSELQMRLSVCNCMYISMSYTYSKYEFLCPDSGVVRASFRSVSSSSLWRCKTGFFHGRGADCDFRRNISKPTIFRYQTRYAQVGSSARARARPRAREPPGSDVP